MGMAGSWGRPLWKHRIDKASILPMSPNRARKYLCARMSGLPPKNRHLPNGKSPEELPEKSPKFFRRFFRRVSQPAKAVSPLPCRPRQNRTPAAGCSKTHWGNWAIWAACLADTPPLTAWRRSTVEIAEYGLNRWVPPKLYYTPGGPRSRKTPCPSGRPVV